MLACKGLAYALSMSSLRGGPVFPSMFLGAAGGIAMSHLPGLPLVPAVAMGIGAMSALLLRSDGVAAMPLVIVAVIVAYLAGLRLLPQAAIPGAAPPGTAPGPADQAAGRPGHVMQDADRA